MRNFSKTLISMAAVMAVGSAMAAGAMAATLSATYSNGTVSIGNVTTGKDQYTLLIVQGEKAAGSSEYKYYAKNTTIKQIDQNDAGVPFTSTTVGTLDAGSYKVLVGNEDGTVDTGYFTVGGTTEPDEPGNPEEPAKTLTIIVGDIDLNEKMRAGDYSSLLAYFTNGKTYDKSVSDYAGWEFSLDGSDGTYIVGDIDKNGKMRAGDYSSLLAYFTNGKVYNESVSDYAGEEFDVIDNRTE
jgi:hypothetical protein